jgi:hypothetical protein
MNSPSYRPQIGAAAAREALSGRRTMDEAEQVGFGKKMVGFLVKPNN